MPPENHDRSQTARTDRRTLLQGLTGLAVTGAALPAFTATAAAHFPPDLEVEVAFDRKRLPPHHSRALVPVAVTNHTEAGVTLDPARFRFGAPAAVADGGGAVAVRLRDSRDVDGDGRADLVLWFRLDEGGFTGDEDVAELRWDRDESRRHGLSGVDSVSFGRRAERPGP